MSEQEIMAALGPSTECEHGHPERCLAAILAVELWPEDPLEIATPCDGCRAKYERVAARRL